MAFDCTECSLRSAQVSFYDDNWKYCPYCGNVIADEAIDSKQDGDIETLAEESEYWIKPENEESIGDAWDVISVSALDTGDGITTELRRSLEACGYEFLSAQLDDRGAIHARFRRLGSTIIELSPSPEPGAVTMTELDEDDHTDPDDG